MVNTTLVDYIVQYFGVNNSSFEKSFFDLFKEYSRTMIKTYEDFDNSSNLFWDFFSNHIDLIAKQMPNMSKGKILSRGKTLNSILASNGKVEHQNFVDTVTNATGRRDIHVLDVGPGSVPTSSIMMGREFDKVSAMDRSFRLSNESLNSLNVNPIEEYMNRDTDVRNYDMVVGCMPCSAIDVMVYLCAKYKKPYVIKTCACEMPNIGEFYDIWNINKVISNSSDISERQRAETQWVSWQNLLPELDPNISFFGSYAFNVEDCKGLTKFLQNKAKKAKHLRNDKKHLNNDNVLKINFAESFKDTKWFCADDENVDENEID